MDELRTMTTVKGTYASDKKRNANAVGTIQAICISDKKGDRKRPVRSAELRAGHGIVGDGHAGPWNRQVSLLPAESIEKMKRKIPDLGAGDFAENLVVAGLHLEAVAIGDRFLQIHDLTRNTNYRRTSSGCNLLLLS